MQIKIRYVDGRPEARKELTNLLRQAGYVIQTRSATGGKASPRRGAEIGIAVDGSLTRQKIATKVKRGALGPRRQRSAVMTLTGPPPAGDGKLSTSRSPAINLRSLRESVGKTQAEIARRTEMSQPLLSRLESRKDHLISTLRKYVRALGGEIEVVASIGGKRVSLRDV